MSDINHNIKGSGEDVKIMTERIGNKVGITVAAAMVSKFINDKDEYTNYTNQIKESVLDLAAKVIPEREVTCQVNVADQIEKGITPQIEGLLEETKLLAKLKSLF